MDPLIVLFGLGVGLLVGTTGIGGGSLMTPLLVLVLGTKPVVAIGTDLAYAAVTKTVGGWRHWRQGTVDLGISLWLALGSVPGALGGVYVIHWLEASYGPHFDRTVLLLLAAALLLTGVATLVRTVFWPHLSERERDTLTLARRHKLAAVAIGVSVGFVLGLTSAGSGALIAIGLILVFRLTPRRVVGTDVFHAAILLWVAAAAHLLSGNVDLGLTANLLVGSIPGVWVGSRLAVKVSPEALRFALGTVLVAAGLALVTKTVATVPTAVVIAAPALLAAAGAGAYYIRGRRHMEARIRASAAHEPAADGLAPPASTSETNETLATP